MATSTADACTICTNSFNDDFYRSVSLPCDHHFCLLCLVRLKASGKHTCPTCRRDWAGGFDVPVLPDMETLAATLQADEEDEGNVSKMKGQFEICKNHSKSYEYWAKDIKEFYCMRCAAENRHVGIELIEDVIPQIKAALEDEIPKEEEKVQKDMESLDERHAELVRQRNIIKKFMGAVQILDDRFKLEIKGIVDTRSKALGATVVLTKLKKKLNNFQSTADIHVAVECKSTLQKVPATFGLPTSNLPGTRLFNIARHFLEEEATAVIPSKLSFVDSLMKPSPETVLAAEKLKGGEAWIVDNDNCEAALLALTDRQPSHLTLETKDGKRKALSVAVIAKAAKGCEVQAKFYDTFISATDTATDAARQEQLIANQSLRLSRFAGHLDHSAISKLPHTLTDIGLAIGSAADAAAVSGLRPWEGLKYLKVSVSPRVSANDLKPLPDGPRKWLYFPLLSDDRVDSVRPAIEALAPDLKIYCLQFPKCQLTAAGASHLTQRLRGVTLRFSVLIEQCGTWRPMAEEKKRFESELRSALGCQRVFRVTWLKR